MGITMENSNFDSLSSKISASWSIKKGPTNRLAMMRGVPVYCENGKGHVHEL